MIAAYRLPVVGILCCALLSCHFIASSYTGIYFLDRSRDLPREQADAIAQELLDALAPFGFREGRGWDPAGIVFVQVPRAASVANYKLRGSDANITIAMMLRNPVSITVRDLSNNDETDFMRALKEAIEKVLVVNGFPDVHFEHQTDLLG